MNISRNTMVFTAFVGAMIVGFSAITFVLRDSSSDQIPFYEKGEFTRSAWQDAAREQSDIHRGDMVDDLLAKVVFTGKTRKQVEAILGETADTDKFSDWDMVYHLGPEPSNYGVDSAWLVFRLDGDGRVSEHAIVTD